MEENIIIISNLNDFIFCPVSIYFHSIDQDSDKIASQRSYQINGSSAHKKIDNKQYSTKKNVLQGIAVYCEKYSLFGKIDTFDADKGILTERKKKIKTIYDGYVFQLYAQYFALCEMGFSVNEIRFYSMDDNRIFNVDLPEKNKVMLEKFEKVIEDMKSFTFEGFKQTNPLKCDNCIYEPLCSYSALG